jgi:hypothetical protein
MHLKTVHPKEASMLIPTLSALGGGLVLLLGAAWWVFRG